MPTDNTSTVVHADVTQHIIDLIESDGEITGITADSSLLNHGLDSLRIMTLVFKLEERYDILLDDEDADDLHTVNDLATLVMRRIAERS